MDIGYLSECAQDYSKELWECKTPMELLDFGRKWTELAHDAYKIISKMTSVDFEEFRKGLKKEHRGHFSGEEWAMKYGAIAMPDLMMRVAMVQTKFSCPFGMAFIRCLEFSYIIKVDDHYEWRDKTEAPKRKDEHE